MGYDPNGKGSYLAGSSAAYQRQVKQAMDYFEASQQLPRYIDLRKFEVVGYRERRDANNMPIRKLHLRPVKK